MKSQLPHTYNDIVSMDNLLTAWQEFLRGKRGKPDVQMFELHLMDNILQLHSELINGIYKHGSYESFHIADPKPRHIHKASVRDRLLHHAIYRQLYPQFDRTFIADSYSCRVGKGTHRALTRFQQMSRKASKNNTRTAWILQCDVRKFFASIDQKILLDILSESRIDKRTIGLLRNIIESFSVVPGKGLPLGNLTSQLLVNIYMNEFDQFMKHKAKVKHYIRYADDFVLFSADRSQLEKTIPTIQQFLHQELQLSLHPNKVKIKTLASGVDFLGWVHFPNHRVLRTSTKRRMIQRVQDHPTSETLQSYLGLLRHGNADTLKQHIQNQFWLFGQE